MSILIYSGAPGSYKTSSAVQEQVIPAIKQGRVIVTNIRGLTRESCLTEYPDAPDTFDVLHVDTSTKEGRDKFARFFHWAPLGALILVDEGQFVFPARWRDKDFELLNYPADPVPQPTDWPSDKLYCPNSTDAAKRDGRPPDFVTAFDMHRHYNWDMVLTTPKIEKIHGEVRGAAEGGFHHRNLAVLGALFKGSYTQGYHDAQDAGRPCNYTTTERKRINKRTFKLYQSTTTGIFSDTKAGTSIFKDPKILFLLFLAIAPFVYVGFTGIPFLTRPPNNSKPSTEAQASKPAIVSSPQVAMVQTGGQIIPVASNSQSQRQGNKNSVSQLVHPLTNASVTIVARLQSAKENKLVFQVIKEDGTMFLIDDKKLSKMGYNVTILDDCLAQVTYFDADSEIFPSCNPEASGNQAKLFTDKPFKS